MLVASIGVLNPLAGRCAAQLPRDRCLVCFASSCWWSYTFSQCVVYQSKTSPTLHLTEVHFPTVSTPRGGLSCGTNAKRCMRADAGMGQSTVLQYSTCSSAPQIPLQTGAEDYTLL